MTYDLLIVGGGINGCAIAREAALHGASVLLVERDDLASHTSSASTKLIHGGLRYLEHYEFRLVAEGLRERERLLHAAPHLIRPLTFVLPHDHGLRPWWMVRLGLWLYDRLGGKSSLPASRGLSASDAAYAAPLKGGAKGFVYADAFVDDARLTLLNAMDAAVNGAEIATRTALEAAHRAGDHWLVGLSDGRRVETRMLVNAAGPWVHLLLDRLGIATRSTVRLVKGSHIVVPRLYEGDHAYILQQPDRRIVFAIPYEGMTEVGTTDVPVERPEDAGIDAGEVAYLCDAINRHFTRRIAPADVVATWSGVRPLYDDGTSAAQAVTRDYVLELDADGPPLLSVFGGKITTARQLAEDAMAKLGIGAGPVTRNRPFPGGNPCPGEGRGPAGGRFETGPRPSPGKRFEEYLAIVRARWPFLGDERSIRMARAYGTMLEEMLAGITEEAGLGADLGGGITETEARWMRAREWAVTADDALDRRSKVGLHLTPEQRAAFTRWWEADKRREP
ncbi:glycerol-3-phosphate dehydrogenase [Sphingomonas cannabina]|uniref:glycerol-3-phosphate dehydrogenase n=1 Tax=Sphingomonas cannabina TaxID=2899123 RepID=UPI001F258534|nr:glycerol-3-phosphate dehydrogenase [Sphingomonas cannabina]UIJ45818.1 glycerol-3-phosphate dehydrogenase [Sphingomonas cannabina]